MWIRETSDAIKRFVTCYLLSICLAVAATGCLYITTQMNKHSGISQAATEEGQFLLGWAAIIVHVTSLVLCGLVAGGAAKNNYRKLAFGMGVIVICGAIFSAMNILGFLASEKLSVTKAREMLIDQRGKDAEARRQVEAKRLDIQAKLVKEQMAINQGTVTQGKNIGKAERKEMRRDAAEASRALIADIGKTETGSIKETPPLPPAALVEGGSELLSDMSLGLLTTRGAQNLQSMWLVMLLLVLETVLWPTASYAWGGFGTAGPSFVSQKPLALEEEAHVTVILPEPPAGQRMLAAPLSRPEPPPEGRIVLTRIGFPKTKPEGDERAMSDEERDTVGIRMLTWLTSHGIRGDFAQDKLWELFLEFFAAQNVVPMAERQAKPALASVNKGRKYYATKTLTSPVVWSIRLPDFEELNGLLDKADFAAAPKPERKSKATAASPTSAPQPEAEEAGTAPSGAASRPFSSGTGTPKPEEAKAKPVKGLGELSRYVADMEQGWRAMARQHKAQWQAKFLTRDKKQGNRFRRARAA